MNQTTVEPTEADRHETVFRTAMAGATNIAWNLGVDEEALAALHDVIDEGAQRRDAVQKPQ